MTDECAAPYYRTVGYVTASTGVVANLTMVYMIFFRSPASLRVYSRVLLLNCLLDSLLTMVNLTVDMRMDVREGVAYARYNGFLSHVATYETKYCLSLVQVFAVYFVMAASAIPLVYRYFVVCHDIEMNRAQLASLLLLAALISLLPPLATHLLFLPAGGPTTSGQNAPCEFRAEFFAVPTMLEAAALPSVGLTFLACFAPVAISYTTILWCSHRVWTTVKSHKSEHVPSVRSVQQQISYVLLLQATSPLLLVLAPVCAVMGAVLLSINGLRKVIEVTTVVLYSVPAFSPIIAILIIKSYRRTLIDFVARCLGFEVNRRASVAPA